MGIQELMMVSGAVVLLGALIYAVVKAGRVRPTRASDEATKRNFHKE